MSKYQAMFLIIIATVVATGAMAQEQQAIDARQVRPAALDHPDRSGAIGRDLDRLLQRQLGADAKARFAFGGDSYLPVALRETKPGKRHGEHQIRPYASWVNAAAVALKFGQFEQSAVGFSKQQIKAATLSLIEELGAHHAANTNKQSWWWGDEWQSAHWATFVATGAWLLWERLPASAQDDVVGMLVFEADRFVRDPPPHSEFGDTKAEENAWNSQILALACNMLPRHPHHLAWAEQARRYMVCSYPTAKDAESDRLVDGKPLKEYIQGPNVHPDHTVENHGFFHPDYLACYSLMVRNACAYRLAGEPVPEATLFNVDPSRDILNFLTLPNGWLFYPQETDWNNYRHEVLISAQHTNPMIPDPVGARALRWGIDFLEYADALHERDESANLFPGLNFNCYPLNVLAESYLLHVLFGPGAAPVTDQEALIALSGTRLFEYGKFVVCRSPGSMASFSWFGTGPRLMGVFTPLSRSTFAVPEFRSLIGYIKSDAEQDGEPADSKSIDPVEIIKRHIDLLPDGGYAVTLDIRRGRHRELGERLAMVALPDGRFVYLESFQPTADAGHKLGQRRTALLYLEDNPYWRRATGWIGIHHPGGTYGRSEVNTTPDRLILDGRNTPWLNVNDRLGIVIRSSSRVELRPGRDRQELSLNYFAPMPQDKRDPAATFAAVFYPQATRTKTIQLSRDVKFIDLGDRAIAVRLDDLTVAVNLSDQPIKFAGGDVQALRARVIAK